MAVARRTISLPTTLDARANRAAKAAGQTLSAWMADAARAHLTLPSQAPPLPACPPERAVVRMEPNPSLLDPETALRAQRAMLDVLPTPEAVAAGLGPEELKAARLAALRAGMDSIGSDSPVPSPTPIDTSSVSERFQMPHIIDGAGGCIGGCDPDLDALCSIGPDDPRRTGKRRQS